MRDPSAARVIPGHLKKGENQHYSMEEPAFKRKLPQYPRH